MKRIIFALLILSFTLSAQALKGMKTDTLFIKNRAKIDTVVVLTELKVRGINRASFFDFLTPENKLTSNLLPSGIITADKMANTLDLSAKSLTLRPGEIVNSDLADSNITRSKLSTTINILLDGTPSGGGIYTPDDETIGFDVVGGDTVSVIKPSYRQMGVQGNITGNTNGDTRGENATDFQLVRTNNDEVASGARSFVAGGQNNKATAINSFSSGHNNWVYDIPRLGTNALNGFILGGINNRVLNWYGAAGGAGNVMDGKIAFAHGNNNWISTNDGAGLGNRTAAGRRIYTVISKGVDTDGDVGTKPYVVVADSLSDIAQYGDVSPFFPNKLISSANVTAWYGAGAQKDTVGNIYSSGYTPAVWNLTDTSVTAENDLEWALHPYMVIKGSGESEKGLFLVEKCIYLGAGSGTKIYYTNPVGAVSPYSTISSVYSSYSPVVAPKLSHYSAGIAGGNGGFTTGRFTSAWSYASFAANNLSKAWGEYSAVFGDQSLVEGSTSFAAGDLLWIDERSSASAAFGASGKIKDADYAFHSGLGGTITNIAGFHANSNGIVSGENAAHFGAGGNASGNRSIVFGHRGKASKNNEIAHGNDYFTKAGDAQASWFGNKVSYTGVGWFEFDIYPTLDTMTTITGHTFISGRQTSSSPGFKGQSCSYEVKWGVSTGSLYSITSVNTTTDYIKLSKNILADSIRVLYETTGSAIGGLSNRIVYWTVNSAGDSTQLSSTEGGSPINLTSAGTGAQTLFGYRVYANSVTLLGRTFKNDGDVVGDGTSTGIRVAGIHTGFSRNKGVIVQLYGLANRTIRWEAHSRIIRVSDY